MARYGALALLATTALLALASAKSLLRLPTAHRHELSEDRTIIARSMRGGHPGAISIYVANIASRFQTWTPEDLWGFRSLGHAVNISDNLWVPEWFSIDKWWINQLNMSPLRVFDGEEADVIFIPATIRYTQAELLADLLDNAAEYLPYLHQKPHVLVLDHPLSTWMAYKPEVLTAHRAVLESLILVTIEGYVKDMDWDFKNSITSPYFGAVHWHRGKERDAGSFLDVAAQKELFALYSGKVRNYPVRARLQKDCQDFGSNCTFLDWNAPDTTTDELGALTFSTMTKAWYTLMPRGDFVTRNSFYEALCAGSIPVVMDQDYFMHCAFSSVIDYSDFLRTIPEADFMGDESKNVLELLSGMHDATAAIKSLHSLWEVNHIFQYSLNPVHELMRFSRVHVIDEGDDAFTFTWKMILRHICSVENPSKKCHNPLDS